ncbi:MAG: hypothetical protein B9S29_04815 [Opitutia bacterium Tous-C2FEB]|jgi:hypothetical protein|nr:MAG: hypothetical protein B9S29_04815 [Opitutae bacterium Tous-C2FEB]PAZ01742.1 MAG: hypothetical protein CAK89_08450 [Opitutae bacterium AMD-G3]
MKNYKYFTFRNFVALNVIDDMHFVDSIGFWRRAKILEIQQAGLDGRPIEFGFAFPLSNADLQLLREKITPAAFEKSLQELLPLMEEGLIVIGQGGDFIKKTSYGYFAITVPEGNIYDAIQAARDDFAKDKDGDFQWHWMIQATTKGWEWANRQIAEMDNAEYHKEQDDFFGE